MQRIIALTVLLLGEGLVGACGDDHDLLECAAREKQCDLYGEPTCVSDSDPEYGCAEPGCGSCALARATSVCSANGRCMILSCEANGKDCNGVQADGCETFTDS